MCDTKKSFIDIFDIVIKNIIIPYFIAPIQYSNDSIELHNLIICSSSIEKVFRRNFKLRFMYYINKVTELNGLVFVKNITFRLNFDQPLKQDTLPGSLTSLTFGIEFNQ